MSKRRDPRKAATRTEPDYPSLRVHLASRRRFLGVAGAVAVGGLASACDRGLGAGADADAGTPPDAGELPADAQVSHDAAPDLPCTTEYAEYLTVRIPASADLTAYLIDEGLAQFAVIAATESQDAQQTLLDELAAAGDRCRDVVAGYTYDALMTGPGVAACEAQLKTTLDDLVATSGGPAEPTLVGVTICLSHLEPSVGMGGVPERPSYP